MTPTELLDLGQARKTLGEVKAILYYGNRRGEPGRYYEAISNRLGAFLHQWHNNPQLPAYLNVDQVVTLNIALEGYRDLDDDALTSDLTQTHPLHRIRLVVDKLLDDADAAFHHEQDQEGRL